MAASVHSLRSLTKHDDPSRVPLPSHRHAAPSAPWPWIDLQDEVDPVQLDNTAPPIPNLCDHGTSCDECWKGYPQSRFPNWTERQVKKARIYDAIHHYSRHQDCIIYHVDVDHKGFFTDAGKFTAVNGREVETWDAIVHETRPDNLRVRCLFLENLSGPVLQMLGAKYNIEPFFWSSSLSWIPSRFQEEIFPKEGDHITVTLTFLRSTANEEAIAARMNKSTDSLPSTLLGSQKIDTHAPLALYSNQRLLSLDLLSVHLIRNVKGSTIISYHPNLKMSTTTAPYLHTRIRFAGQSVYWQSMFQKSPDPTFILLTFIWHAMYAWDEALEHLYEHICALENRVITTASMPLTQELHVIRAHHLHYSSLLDDFSKNVKFIKETRNPAMEFPLIPEGTRKMSRSLLDRECDTLLTEIKRLSVELAMQERRLRNVMNLVFSSVNINDSRYMRQMTEAAVRDSAAMKQIAYLTMIFAPATFVAGIFGMNIHEINPGTLGSLPHYIAVAVPLTIVTIWIIIAFQSKYLFKDDVSIWRRLAWPFFLARRMLSTKKGQRGQDEKEKKLLESYSISSQEAIMSREFLDD